MSQHAVIWWCVYGCTAGFEGVCEGMQGLRSWVELWIYEDEVWEARRARRGRGSSMPGDNQESEETECSGSRGEVYGCLTWWTCCMADVIGFEMPQLIESKPFYVRWSKLLLMVYMVGMSRQCPAICICKFIMQLVNVCTYYYLLLFWLLSIIQHSSGQLYMDFEVTQHVFHGPTKIWLIWFYVQEIIQEKYGGQLFEVSSQHEKHPNLDLPLILTYQFPWRHQMRQPPSLLGPYRLSPP